MAFEDPSQLQVQVTFPEQPFGGVQVIGAAERPLQIAFNNGSAVTRFNGRVGDIIPLCGDYSGCYAPKLASLPQGGTTGQVLTKIDNTDYNANWQTPSGGGAVTSVFGRTGAVTALAGDYAAFYSPILNYIDSISLSGSNVLLLGDVASPGNNMLYGTNNTGIRGWYAQPASFAPGGLNTQLQFNNSGVFGGVAGATWNGSLLSLNAGTTRLSDPIDPTKTFFFQTVNIGTATNMQVNLPLASSGVIPAPISPISHEFLTSLSSSGIFGQAQPAFTDISGTLASTQMPALTGDVTSSPGAVATTISAGAVTYAKMQNASAEAVICRAASSSGVLGEITLAASQLFGRGSTGDLAAIALGTNLSMSGGTLNAAGGASYVFADSIVNTGGTVTLVGDSASPGNNKRYGTNSSGTLGYYDQPVAGSITGHGNSDYTILSTDRIVYTNAAFTSFRTWTLPAANAVPAGTAIQIIDWQGTITFNSNFIVVARAGADLIYPGGLTQIGILNTGNGVELTSDGNSKWTVTRWMPGTNAMSNPGSVLTSYTGTSRGWSEGQWTLPLMNAVGNSGQILISNGTNVVFSIPSYPNSAGNAGSIVQANGANFVLSTPAWPTLAGTSQYQPTSNGTNFVNKPQCVINGSTAQQTGFASDTYLSGSAILIAAGDFSVGTIYHCVFDMAKTGAGTVAPVISIRVGTAGTTADTAVQTITFGAGTAVADVGRFEVYVNFRAVGASATVASYGACVHNGTSSAVGLVSTQSHVSNSTSSTFSSTAATTIGISFNGGASFSGTCNIVQAQLNKL